MFDIYKKLDEEQNNGELAENVEEKITVEENITEDNATQENAKEGLGAQEPYQSEDEKILFILEALGGEEQALLAEKSQLVNMEATLRYRIREEIEIKRQRIDNLKHEIPELKQRCEILAKALNIPVQK